jgi:hypothetical protein
MKNTISNPEATALRRALSASMERFAWERVVGAFDEALEHLA